VAARVATGIQPKSVDVSPDGSRIYVSNFGRPDRDNVRVYDARTLAQVGVIEFAGNAVETEFSPDGATLYVSNFRRGVVEVVDTATLTVRGEIEVGANPKVIARSPDGSRIYVANWSSDTISIVDAASLATVGQLRTGRHPRGMAVTLDGRLFIAGMYSHLIHVFDPNSRTRIAEWTPCRFPRHLALSPDQGTLYATCSCCRQVRSFDAITRELRVIAQTGENPRSMDISSDGRYLGVADFDDGTVSVIDTVELKHQIFPIPGVERVVGLALQPGPDLRIYATSWNSAELIVLEPVPAE
jgi:YVTN family beta-propeller protein